MVRRSYENLDNQSQKDAPNVALLADSQQHPETEFQMMSSPCRGSRKQLAACSVERPIESHLQKPISDEIIGKSEASANSLYEEELLSSLAESENQDLVYF